VAARTTARTRAGGKYKRRHRGRPTAEGWAGTLARSSRELEMELRFFSEGGIRVRERRGTGWWNGILQ
jgi:hypothetical protein